MNIRYRIFSSVAILCMSTGLSGGKHVLAAVEPDQDDSAGKDSISFAYDDKGRRDPFQPLVVDGRIVAQIRQQDDSDGALPILYGILWDEGGRSIALINDTEAQAGDKVGGFTIKTINRQSVIVVNKAGAEKVLELSFE